MNTEKELWRPGNMLYPLPAVLVSVADRDGNSNLLTIAWAGTVCSDPAMVSISVRKQRFSHHIIEETGEFVINLTTEKLAFATDFCGVRSGRDLDKWETCKLTPIPGKEVKVPLVKESPVNIECRVKQKLELGTHDMFIAEVVAVHADKQYMDEKGRFDLSLAKPLVYSHGTYYTMGKPIGKFGYSVNKKNKADEKKTPAKHKNNSGKKLSAGEKETPNNQLSIKQRKQYSIEQKKDRLSQTEKAKKENKRKK